MLFWKWRGNEVHNHNCTPATNNRGKGGQLSPSMPIGNLLFTLPFCLYCFYEAETGLRLMLDRVPSDWVSLKMIALP